MLADNFVLNEDREHFSAEGGVESAFTGAEEPGAATGFDHAPVAGIVRYRRQ